MTAAERSLTSRHGVPLYVSAALMVVALAVGVIAVRRVADAYDWVEHSYQVIVQANRCAALIRFAEAEQRGYIITGKDEFLEQFNSSNEALTVALERLQHLVVDDKRQTDRVLRVRELIDQRMLELRSAATLRSISEEAGVTLVLAIRDVAGEIANEESRLLELRHARMWREIRYSVLTSGIIGFVALLMGGNTFFVMRRALQALDREARLVREKERAEESDREKSEFLANMSHEIRTPMNSVLGFADLLQGVTTTQKQRQYVEAINTSGRALLTLINDILDLSKVEAGRIEVAMNPTSIRAIFDGVKTIFSQQALERGLNLDFVVEDSVPPSLVFDSARLRQILFNTVGNALKFTSEGSVTVTARAHLLPDDETAVVLSINVADTGIGIAQEHWESIFESFRQVGEGLDRRHGGTGLGLSITRRLTEILGGKVELESEPDRGTEFRFTFPKVGISAELPEEEKRFSADEDFNLLRPSLILAADDVPLNRELVAGYLEGTHHRLIQASTGREAFERARQFQPDLVLMDIRMPDLDGEEALEEMRADESLALVPVIAVTASSMLGEEHRLRTIFDGYIRKPFSRTTLFREVAHFIAANDGATEKHELPIGTIPTIEATPANAAAWSAMVERLREMQTESWKLLTESLGIRETKAFALELVELAEQADCRPLQSYAQQMLTAADRFDIRSLEESVAAFPIVVNRLEAVTHTGP